MSPPPKENGRHPSASPAHSPRTRNQDGILDGDDAQRKLIATLQARAALAGIRVDDLGHGAFLIRRWAYAREVQGIDALRHALALQGVET